MPEKKPIPQLDEEMNKDNIGTPAAMEMLGVVAAASLKNYGQATFVMRPDGGVAYANPAHVHVHPQAIEDLADRPYRLVRPILGDGRPNFVVWKDSILWEVELVDEQSEEKPGS